MNIIPEGYPNIWAEDINKWVSEDYYMFDVNPIQYETMNHGAYDEEYGVVFITRKFQEGDLTYSVMLASLGVVRDDVHIYSIKRLYGTNEAPDFTSKNYSSEQLNNHGELEQFQTNERFYADIQVAITGLKRDILLIVDSIWYRQNYIIPI